MSYREVILKKFWEYQELRFSKFKLYFEGTPTNKNRPPVLYPQTEWLNVITHSDATKSEVLSLLEYVPKYERHRWYRSFTSSQALARVY